MPIQNSERNLPVSEMIIEQKKQPEVGKGSLGLAFKSIAILMNELCSFFKAAKPTFGFKWNFKKQLTYWYRGGYKPVQPLRMHPFNFHQFYDLIMKMNINFFDPGFKALAVRLKTPLFKVFLCGRQQTLCLSRSWVGSRSCGGAMLQNSKLTVRWLLNTFMACTGINQISLTVLLFCHNCLCECTDPQSF